MEKGNIPEKLDKFLKEVNEQYAIEFAYLFGSFATGTYNKTSDIDIAIMFAEKYEPKKEAIIKGSITDMGQKYFQKKIDIVSLNNATPLLRYEIIKEGIPIKESKKEQRLSLWPYGNILILNIMLIFTMKPWLMQSKKGFNTRGVRN